MKTVVTNTTLPLSFVNLLFWCFHWKIEIVHHWIALCTTTLIVWKLDILCIWCNNTMSLLLNYRCFRNLGWWNDKTLPPSLLPSPLLSLSLSSLPLSCVNLLFWCFYWKIEIVYDRSIEVMMTRSHALDLRSNWWPSLNSSVYYDSCCFEARYPMHMVQ